MRVEAGDSLRTVAFKVCSALSRAGAEVVLTGGSAATVYAPEAYQSTDLDFVLEGGGDSAQGAESALMSLGYSGGDGHYVHDTNSLTLEFLRLPIAIGRDTVHAWVTLREGESLLHILSPTDSCRDRLAHFLFWNDRSALEQAVAVALRQRIDMKAVRDWCRREGHGAKFAAFEKELAFAHPPRRPPSPR